MSQYHQYDTKVYDGDGADIDAPKLEGGRDSMASTVDGRVVQFRPQKRSQDCGVAQ